MASEHVSPHLANCECGFCPVPPEQQPQQQQLQPQQEQLLQQQPRSSPQKASETALVAMKGDRKDYFEESSYETASDSDNDRNKKDDHIRQAPYLPRIQIWARESGPYTLRIGHQWFHCDDLLINGDEYRSQTKKTAPAPSTRPAQSGTQQPTPVANKRKPLSRAASYQRTRPDDAPTSRPNITRQASRDKVPGAARYESQALPEPRRKHASRKVEDGVKKSAHRSHRELGTSPRDQPDVKVPVSASNGQLVQYKNPPPTSNPPPAYHAPRQTRPARPGRLSRGNSYQIPVRNKSKKAVRFAPLPG